MKSFGKRTVSAIWLVLLLFGLHWIAESSSLEVFLPPAGAQIDNRYNVEHYPYQSDSLVEHGVRYLKDCDYSFWEELSVPGMPQTRENDFLNHYIYSEAQCPQGICLTEEFVLLTSYSSEDGCMGELMVFDREDGSYLVTLGMDEKSHLGGIAYDGRNVWVCNSEKNTIERISYDFIQLMARENTKGVVDAAELVDTYPVQNKPSCITWYGGRLWVATHTLFITSRMTAYYFDSQKDELVALSRYKIPNKVQGIAFDQNGSVYLSTSYGRNDSSYIKGYSSIIALTTHPNRPSQIVEMPPASEEIDISSGTLYVLFESAGEKYLEGTDGKGKSRYPIDQILMVSLDSIR